MGTTTLQDLHDLLDTMIREPYSQGNKWTPHERLLWLNKGKDKIAFHLKCCKYQDTMTISGSVGTYNISGSLTYPRILDIDAERGVKLSGVRLNRKYESQLDMGGTGWQTTSGTPTNYLFRKFSKQIELSNIPESDSSDLRVSYTYMPDDLVDLTDTIDIPDEHAEAIALYAAWNLWRKRGKFAQAKEFKSDYYETVKIGVAEKFKNNDGQVVMTGYTEEVDDIGDVY